MSDASVNLHELKRLHFVDSSLVTNGSAEPGFQKSLDQFPRECGPDHLSAQTKDIHVVVFNALVSREHVMDEACAHTGNFVGADGGPHAAAAERNSAIDCAASYGPGQRDNVVRVIVSGAHLIRAEVYDLMGGTAKQIRNLLFQNEPSMV
jgi:hypothetical protein